MNETKSCVIIVGAGLAGLTAVHTVIEAGGYAVLLEKSSSLLPPSSNSSFSSSGINGCNSSIQRADKVEDSLELFLDDITKTGTKKSHLLEIVCSESGNSVDWLVSTFGLSLTLSRSGGHGCARTHKTSDRATGYTTVSNMAKKAMEIAAAEPGKLMIVTGAAASQLVVSEEREVRGVMFEKDGKVKSVHGGVILCTGGFGADFTSVNSTIARYRPDLVNLATACNLDTSLGDGIRLGEEAGAKLVDMMFVQVNPTGLVDPKDPESRFKTTASESLREDGGIIVDRHGKRFVNELAKRDFLSSELLKREGPFYIIINARITRHVKAYIEEYIRSGLMTQCSSGTDLAEAIGVSAETLKSTLDEYNWASLVEKDDFGKTRFRNCPFEMKDSYCVSQIEPVIHYCAGGLMINQQGNVIGQEGQAIPGLYAAGEVTGGIHGAYPFTGNDLLDCVVFGRIAAVSAARETYGASFVEEHLNLEIVKEKLLEAIRKEDENMKTERNRKNDLEEELRVVDLRVEIERKEVGDMCAQLRSDFGSLHKQLESLAFDPLANSLDQMFGVNSAKKLFVELRNKRKQVEGEADALKDEIANHRAQINETESSRETHRKKMLELKWDKRMLEKKLEEVRKSSPLVREIHELEDAISEFNTRQQSAEESQDELVKEHADFQTKIQQELAEMKVKKEELEVMMSLDKVEQRKELEQMSLLVDRMRERISFETYFAKTARDLAANDGCPIFQRPLKRDLCLTPLINSSNLGI
jgi:flavocytochrome c